MDEGSQWMAEWMILSLDEDIGRWMSCVGEQKDAGWLNGGVEGWLHYWGDD